MSTQLHGNLSPSVAEARRFGVDHEGTLGAAGWRGSIRHAVRSILSARKPALGDKASSPAVAAVDEAAGAQAATGIESPGSADAPAAATPPPGPLTAPAPDVADPTRAMARAAPVPERADMAAPPAPLPAANIIHIGVQYMTTPADRAGNAASRIGRL